MGNAVLKLKERHNKQAKIWYYNHLEQARRTKREWMRKDRLQNTEKYRLRGKQWRQVHPSKYIGTERARKYYPIFYAKQTARQKPLQQLKYKPCMDCGDWFPTCAMQFDHRDPTTKLCNISRLRSSSVKNILEEVAKCDVVCANCHFIRTASRKSSRYGWMNKG